MSAVAYGQFIYKVTYTLYTGMPLECAHMLVSYTVKKCTNIHLDFRGFTGFLLPAH
jgi:hypothetical protein